MPDIAVCRVALAVMVLMTSTAFAAAKHPGPLGLDWGKSPPEARSILQGKLTFVSEGPSGEAPYDTIDQHYAGTFGDLAVSDVLLKFYKGEFFYMLVKVQTVQPDVPQIASPTFVFEQVVSKMRRAYGAPTGLTAPPALGSDRAIYDNLPLAAAEKSALPYLWNEQLKVDEAALYRVKDQQIKLQHWDPFAGWRFANAVTVQTFMWQELGANGRAGPLQPVWIFAKMDRFKAWRAAVRTAEVVPPRDF